MRYLVGAGDLLVEQRVDLAVLFPFVWFSRVLSCFIGNAGGASKVGHERGQYEWNALWADRDRLCCGSEEELQRLMNVLMEMEFCAEISPQQQQQQEKGDESVKQSISNNNNDNN